MDPTLYAPWQAARILGVSPATLRRMAALVEEVLHPLPRDAGGGRLWPEGVLGLLAEARGRAKAEGIPLREALLQVKEASGAEGAFPPPPPLATQASGEEALALLRALLERLTRVEGELAALRAENQALRESLKALEAPRPRRPWWAFWRR